MYGIGTGSVTALAGCTDGVDPGSGDGSDGGSGDGADGDGTDGEDGEDGEDGADGEVETAVRQAGSPLSGPAWSRTERRGICMLITEEYGDGTWTFDEAPEPVRAFVEETDFAKSVVVYVESVGPSTCHDAIAFDAVGVEDGTLVVDATVEGAESDDVACGEAITYAGALLRVTSDPLPEAVRISLTDGWGETATVRDTDGVRDPDGLAGGVRPDGDPATVPASFDCDVEGFERHPQWHGGDVDWGGGGAHKSEGGDADYPLALRVITPGDDAGSGDDLAVARDERFRIELTNLSGRTEYVGNRGKHNLEIRTEAGWVELRGTDGDARFGYNDEAVGVRPGETLTWEFEMTESGLVEASPHADDLRVCPELVPGRYRFVFFGAADFAVAFDYVG